MANNNKKLSLESLPEDWVDTSIGLYEQGAGDEEVQKELRITPAAFESLLSAEPYFLQVIQYGRLCRKAWYLKWGRTHLTAKGANYTGWFQQMKNLYGWSDKQQQIISDGEISNMSNEEIELKLAAVKEELMKNETKKVS